jgi:hypothetical protein
MGQERYTPEQIIWKLRRAEVELAKGQSAVEVTRKLGIAEQTYCRWRKEFRYRFNPRWREVELFDFVLRRAIQGDPLPYHRLTAEEVG